jgi:molybdopterin biosynthesis enzyme
MRPFTSTISLDEARRRLTAAVRPIARTERVALDVAAGRVAAGDIRSPIDVPPFARSAMDGYAVVAADTEGASRQAPARLRQIDRIFTGTLSSVAVARGTCAEIATGAPLPAGADAVVMVEETAKPNDETIEIFAAAAPGQNIGRRGADIAAGDRVIVAGDLLSPGRVGAIAAIGGADVEVFAKPLVAILSTGNEVVEPGQPLRMAAWPNRGGPRRTRSTRSCRRSTSVAPPISSSSPEAVQSASAISWWTPSLPAAR